MILAFAHLSRLARAGFVFAREGVLALIDPKPLPMLPRVALRLALGIDPQRGPIMGWCGRLASEKGLTYLIQALPSLCRRFPDLLVILAGEGELRGPLEREARSLGVHSQVLFAGPRSDVPALMRLFDVFALPSLREGLPLVLLEAMAASVPIVATSVGGNPEIVRHGATGLLVPPCDPAALAAALDRVLSNRELRASFAQKRHDLLATKK